MDLYFNQTHLFAPVIARSHRVATFPTIISARRPLSAVDGRGESLCSDRRLPLAAHFCDVITCLTSRWSQLLSDESGDGSLNSCSINPFSLLNSKYCYYY